MVKLPRVRWSSPAGGGEFAFEYEVTRNTCGASSVRNVRGTIHRVVWHDIAETTNGAAAAGAGEGERARKRIRGQEEVGLMEGQEIRRGANGNKNFHSHADAAGRELSEFASALYDGRGEICRAPRCCGIRDVCWTDGSMLLVEKIEIKPEFRGMDLGISFLHAYLSQNDIARRVGVVVMNPWTLSDAGLHYPESRESFQREREGKDESEAVDLDRGNTAKLRRQFSRMGFRAIGPASDWVDKWWMSMSKYRTMAPADVRSGWLSKEEAARLDVPMPARKHVCSDKDNELKDLIRSLKADPPDPYAAQMGGLRRQMESLRRSVRDMRENLNQRLGPVLGRESSEAVSEAASSTVGEIFAPLLDLMPDEGDPGSKLTDERRAGIRRLVDAGADIAGINALHLAAAMYKEEDLFDLLVDEYKLDLEGFDDIGRRPIHVAACCSNADAVRILLARGAAKDGKNEEGRTALEDMDRERRGMDGFARAMMGAAAGGDGAYYKVRALLL